MKLKNRIKRSRAETCIGVIAFTLAVLYAIGLIVVEVGSDTDTGSESVRYSFEYENYLFDTSTVHTIDLRIKNSDWQTLKNTSLEKNFFSCDAVIDGETFCQVGVRTKGNSTLVQSIAQGWDRQSLVLDFGKFNQSQRYHGLDELSLYNSACDSSYMKNMICLSMMQSTGIASPLCSFTAVYLNGEYLGLYTAMEGVGESFAYRNFGGQHGQIYKPEQYDISALLTGEKTNISINLGALTESADSVDISDFLQASDSTVALQYQGENLSLYDEIWNNSVFKIGRSDKKRLVASLKGIQEGTDVSQYANIEELARYFAVNTFVLNTDAYLTNMAHNYYLYEKDGVLSMLPWDYDQTMGTVGAVGSSGEITEFINNAIDTPLTNTTLVERPMLAAVLNDGHGKEVYYETLQTLVYDWVYSGYLDERITAYKKIIRPYVESDPNMAERMEVFDAAVESVRQFCWLRSNSINGQLSGTIPSSTIAQKVAPETLVDASSFSSPDSGSFFDLLMQNDPNLGLEDVVDRLLAQANVVSIVKNMPFDELHEIFQLLAEGENSSIGKLTEAGLIKDTEHFKDVVILRILEGIRPILLLIMSAVTLSLALILVKRYGKNRKPCARRCG
ncbi:MAG: CotH kinase family protein [Eubacteriales bacterium]